jgi:hypothetical protein
MSLEGVKMCDYYVFVRPDADYGARLASLKVNSLLDQDYNVTHVRGILEQYGIKKSLIIEARRKENPLEKAQDEGMKAVPDIRYFDAKQFAAAEKSYGPLDHQIKMSHAYHLDLLSTTHYLATDFLYLPDQSPVYDVQQQKLGIMHSVLVNQQQEEKKALQIENDTRLYWQHTRLGFLESGSDIVLLGDNTRHLPHYGHRTAHANPQSALVLPFVA